MGKINFTKEHYDKMCILLLAMLMSNRTITTKLGQPLDAVNLLHTTTINTLNTIRLDLGKEIEKMESVDEWAEPEYNQQKLAQLREKKELVNLVIGYKRYLYEVAEVKAKKIALEAQLEQLKESQKTPEDRIKDIEAQLADLNKESDF